ncbi:hypothetical protein [Actinophytocola gossypii]|uniref:Alanine-rich protein n=1 Tax=Actinophytocola gossypii TaxID=2812003 RepID=A0ABT2J8K8_9PSEU|nr:hypothetical protein [Actinophytocola gossypii]MCT2584207.1 hypothetical protein [Actinophytocola gossypii]
MITGHAYPWDVLGDPAFPDRAHAAGVTTVALASAYHSVRAATPLHPDRALVKARHAALYRPVRESAWTGRLRPATPDWMSTQDSFGEAAETLRAAGFAVSAWIVLTHNTRLGTEHPDVAVVNCFGERYPYALCPSWPEVREYAATLATEAAAGADAVSLEACGQLGLTHQCHHEKTDGAYSPAATRWLSVCCCPACRRGWNTRGLDPAEVVSRLRAAVREDTESLPGEAELLATRHASTDELRAGVLAGLDVPVTLHAHPDPWATGASPGLTPTAADDVSALVVPAWPTTPVSAEVVAGAAATGRPVDAYVTVLPPADPAGLPDHWRRLRASGATGAALYHLGLAPRSRQPLFRVFD